MQVRVAIEDGGECGRRDPAGRASRSRSPRHKRATIPDSRVPPAGTRER
jgi:hypothetical protein